MTRPSTPPAFRRSRTEPTSPTSSTGTRRRSTRSTTTALRSALADDIWAQYGNGDPVEGGDKLAAWIAEATATVIWQHHLLNVYHVTIDGDQAKTLSYLTSYQVFEENPDAAIILVARYHDELRRTPDGWKISRRVMELLWGESKADEGYPGRPRRSRAQDLAAQLTTHRSEENNHGDRSHSLHDDAGPQGPRRGRRHLQEVHQGRARRRTTASSPTTTSSTRTR